MIWRPTVRVTPLAVGIVMVFLVLGAVYVDMQDSSPGQLAAAHAGDARLTGAKDCSLCHGSDDQTMAEACVSCHQEIGIQLNAATGFHGNMDREVASECAQCHSEHHGSDFQLTNARSFTLSGVTDPRAFEHDWLDFLLAGKHLQLACDQCHPNAHAKVLSKGEQRFLGLSQECSHCHEDVHKGNYGRDCESCHGQEHPFPKVANFAHTSDFPLIGAHAEPACVVCHEAKSRHGVNVLLAERERGVSGGRTRRTCRECHESPHQETFLVAVSQQWNETPDRCCQHCHPTTHETFCGPQATLEPAQHACTGFPLDAPHDQVSCEGCHAGYGKEKGDDPGMFRRLYPGRLPDDCQVCHGDPHQGQFELGPLRGSHCLDCHDRHTFMPLAFTARQHDLTNFPLAGAHGSLACRSCHLLPDENHLGRKPRPADLSSAVGRDASRQVPASASTAKSKRVVTRIFHGTPNSCRACHEDPHQDDFAHGPFRQEDCRACHSEHTFGQSTFTIEQHKLTRFPLTGAHQAVACTLCHQSPEQPTSSRRGREHAGRQGLGLSGSIQTSFERRGNRIVVRLASGDEPWPRQHTLPPTFHGTPTECASCHEDVHEGQFQQPHLPATVDGRSGCARCHTTERFDLVRASTFDHALWTGYPLRGAHARAKCTDCHAQYVPGANGRTYRRVPDRNCQTCHADPHVGQFGPTRQVDCTRCHVEGDSFQQVSFDHQRDSRFVLDEQHARLECSACHQRQRLRDGRVAIRYKPLGIQCGDCHVPRGPRQTPTRSRQ